MYNIVLADDEQIEIDSLKEIIEGILPDCRVMTAPNGQLAVEAAQQLKADIAFMDIQMPSMDGLSAARQIKSEQPNCEIMFLTAYSDFGYAKEAVELGASGYLLKPCNRQNLLSALNRMVERINMHRDEEMRNEQRRISMELLKREFEEQLVLTVMGGYLRPEWAYKQLALMDIFFSSGVFVIMKSPDGISAERLRGMVNGVCWRSGMHHFSYEYDDSLYVLVISSIDSNCGDYVYQLLRGLSYQTEFHQHKRLICAVSEQFNDMAYVQNAFYHAFCALQKCSDENTVFRSTVEMENGQGNGESEILVQMILNGERESAANTIRNFLECLCARQFEIGVMILKTLNLLQQVFEELQDQSGMQYEVVFHIESRFEHVTNCEGIFTVVNQLIGEVMDYEAGIFMNHMTQIKFEIEEYMKANFKRDIFMQQVASEMNYSTAHFSRLFKNCFKKNFVTYLTEMRVNAAKDLLSRPVVSIKTIGEEVGYKDSSHFTKVFRRIEGVSPSEYRASLFPEKV
mgnify:CR=1 FL=1